VNKKMLFCRVLWMDSYRGPKGDKPMWGGEYDEEYEHWDEVHNFSPHSGEYFGDVYLRREKTGHLSININNLGAGDHDDKVEDVLVIWVAYRPHFGPVVVGWFDHATVYRKWKELRTAAGSRRYYFRAKTSDCKLLQDNQRRLRVDGFGRSHVWYAFKAASLRAEVYRRIKARRQTFLSPARADQAKAGRSWPPDAKKRLEVEQAAVVHVTRFFRRQGYDVDNVEKLKLGWDLEARREEACLRLEVKGLSGGDVFTELTPNEYAMSKTHRSSYQICVVTNAPTRPKLHVFRYSESREGWLDDDGAILDVEEVTVRKARLSMRVA